MSAGLTSAELDAIGEAYRGPWGPSHKTPDRLLVAVEQVVAARMAQAWSEGWAAAWDMTLGDAFPANPYEAADDA